MCLSFAGFAVGVYLPDLHRLIELWRYLFLNICVVQLDNADIYLPAWENVCGRKFPLAYEDIPMLKVGGIHFG